MDAWLCGLDPLPTIDEASASVARELIRARGAAIGLGRIAVESLAVAASELVHNQLRHARRGRFAVRAIERAGVPGLEIVAADMGPGIADPRLALAGPGSSEGSLGAGLYGARNMVHEMDVDVRLGEGTAIRARAFAEPVERRREIGILGRPFPEERVSGDHAVFVREGDTLLCAVIDGIGHGPLAGDAAAQAVAEVLANAGAGLATLLKTCDAALVGTRGAVMAVARIHEILGTVEHAAVGNVVARIDGYRRTHALPESASTLGRRGRHRARIAGETAPIAPGEALVLFSDGIASRATLADAPDVLREHPIVVAQHLLTTFGRITDDALVLVAR
jgi:anti-sigma regulatory factor (Ser/Thr protein kinase)